MKKLLLTALFLPLLVFASYSQALSEPEAEDLADLTAIFVYLKNNCGYTDLPNAQIKKAIVYFAQQNRWDLSNYNSFNMQRLGEESYNDLSRIAIAHQTKCDNLARDTLGLLAYVR